MRRDETTLLNIVEAARLVASFVQGLSKATVDIRTCELLEGDLPNRQRKLALAWAELHQDELMADWHLVMNGEDPFKIQPLQ